MLFSHLTMIEAGDKAPLFALDSDGGERVTLEKLRGKTVVLYFYPRDDTPGCTREAQGFTALLADLKKAGALVYGASKDSIAAHCKFRDKYKLTVPLLSDPDLAVHKAYGAFGKKVMYGKTVEGVIRSTFIIGPDGVVTRVFPSVKVNGHPEAVLAYLTGGGAPAKKTAAKTAKKPVTKAVKRALSKVAKATKKIVKKVAKKVSKSRE